MLIIIIIMIFISYKAHYIKNNLNALHITIKKTKMIKIHGKMVKITIKYKETVQKSGKCIKKNTSGRPKNKTP